MQILAQALHGLDVWTSSRKVKSGLKLQNFALESQAKQAQKIMFSGPTCQHIICGTVHAPERPGRSVMTGDEGFSM